MAIGDPQPALPPLIGQSRPFLDLMEGVSRLATLDRPILVVGERGTGKELVVARLHYLSRRWDRPFVGVNCAALAESLLDSELFGHEAGAFTGADRRRRGRFEQADGGTLFLDEIATASGATQEKILRAVEYGTIQRLGAERQTSVDVRVVAATNVDLPAAAAAGRFRADLLDRLAFDVVTVPPLRARADDIPLLTTHFARAFAVEIGWDDFPGFTPEALAALACHDWPGNVRELRAAVERSVARAQAAGAPVAAVVLDPFASPHWRGAETAVSTAVPEGGLMAHLARIERAAVAAALTTSRHNQRRAATALGLTYAQLRYLVQKHNLGT
ncbi:MAG: phage shock protein operon transcriptional activator [Alphaproteobacteria bacterium]|nr:phage shock protein operon transcriptional activator [Alphaproteobacteria bacterium]